MRTTSRSWSGSSRRTTSRCSKPIPNTTALRRFESPDEVVAALGLGQPHRPPGLQLLSLWAPKMNGAVDVKRIELKLPGHSFREQAGGWGLLTLQLSGLMPDGLEPSYVNANSEKRALKWESTYTELGVVEAWDWQAVSQVLRRITGWIRRHAVAKEEGRPILLGAEAARRRGIPLRPF